MNNGSTAISTCKTIKRKILYCCVVLSTHSTRVRSDNNKLVQNTNTKKMKIENKMMNIKEKNYRGPKKKRILELKN